MYIIISRKTKSQKKGPTIMIATTLRILSEDQWRSVKISVPPRSPCPPRLRVSLPLAEPPGKKIAPKTLITPAKNAPRSEPLPPTPQEIRVSLMVCFGKTQESPRKRHSSRPERCRAVRKSRTPTAARNVHFSRNADQLARLFAGDEIK
jgi:hypothetical protein